MMRATLSIVLLASTLMSSACSSESDGRNVVMVAPEEGSGAEVTGTSSRPQSVTIGESAAAQPQVADWEQDAAQMHSEATQRSGQLSQAISSDRCDEADEIRNRICALAERICAISESHPGHQATGQRCQDAEERCSHASERISSRCEY